jgi:hypothetical protein
VEIALGFAIALAISLTGVGAGSMTTPLLILLLGVPPAIAVGTALTFGAIIKVIAVPAYVVRRQVSGRVLKYLLAGGIPGVIAGSFLLRSFKTSRYEGMLYGFLGILIVLTAGFHLYRTLRPPRMRPATDRSPLLPWLALPISAEVGFSSAGAGALGSLALFGFTKLAPAEVVGTDLCFGLIVSSIGSAMQLTARNYDGALLLQLVAGGILGAVAGSLLAGRIAALPMRVTVLAMLVVLGMQLAVHGQTTPHPPLRAALHWTGR